MRVRARTRLLLALFSHSIGSLGACLSTGFIDYLSLCQSRFDHKCVCVAVTFDVLWSHHDYIHRGSHALEIAVDGPRRFASGTACFYDKQVDVAMAVHVSASGGTKEDDPLGLGRFYNPTDDRPKQRLIQNPARTGCRPHSHCGPPRDLCDPEDRLRAAVFMWRHCTSCISYSGNETRPRMGSYRSGASAQFVTTWSRYESLFSFATSHSFGVRSTNVPRRPASEG